MQLSVSNKWMQITTVNFQPAILKKLVAASVAVKVEAEKAVALVVAEKVAVHAEMVKVATVAPVVMALALALVAQTKRTVMESSASC